MVEVRGHSVGVNTLPTGGMSHTVKSTNGEPYFLPWMPISFQVTVNELADHVVAVVHH